MVYFDTSFLAPLILEEATSGAVERFVANLPAGSLATSHWTRVEFASLLAREVRMDGLDGETAILADAQFEAMVEASFHLLTPDAEDFTLAHRYISHHDLGLRAGDALHLAVAANRRAEAVYSLDKRMGEAGTLLGLPALKGLPAEA